MSKRDDELAREIQTHLDLEAEEQMAAGLSADSARRAAHRAFGNVAHAQEDARAVWVPRWADETLRDLRYTTRSLLRHKAFAATAILTLALGIGANTAIFSLMDQMLLRTLPVEHPESLVVIEGPGPFQGYTNRDDAVSVPMFRGLAAASGDVLQGLFARFSTPVTLSIDGGAERATAEVVSGSYFDLLGLSPVSGRLLGPADDQVVDGHPVAVLSHAFWRRRFSERADVVGRTITINNLPMTVVGVAPVSFVGFEVSAPADVFVPLMMKRTLTPTRDDLASWRARWVTLTGRLKDGVPLEQANAALNVAYRPLLVEDSATAHLDPGEHELFWNKRLVLTPGGRGLSALRASYSTVLVVLMGMVGLVLLTACANVASLLVARAAGQQREVAICLALGAGRGRVVRQRLVETSMLAVLGGAAGIVLALAMTQALIEMLPFAGARALSPTPDARVLMFTAIVAGCTVFVAGTWPAWHATRPELVRALKEETASVAGGGREARVRRGVVTMQVAMSIVLLVGAAVFARSLYGLRHVAVGFATDHLLQLRLDLASAGYSPGRARTAVAQLENELRRSAGVVAVSSSVTPALSGSVGRQTVLVQGYEYAPGEDRNPRVLTIGPHYFETMGIPIVDGREFGEGDSDPRRRVAVVNETMARYFWKGEMPIGRRFGRPGSQSDTEFEVVGVVKDSRFTGVRDQVARLFYVPYMQADTFGSTVLYVRYRGNADAIIASVTRSVRQFDAGLPIYDMRTVESQLERSLFVERMLASLSLVFAALATLLVAVGVYGVVSSTVVRRTRELGIRIALGASRGVVSRLVIGDIALMLLIGVGISVPVVFVLGRVVVSQLSGLSSVDTVSIVAAVLLLAATSTLAAYLPARRASRIDPLRALRYE